ncbi:metallopeptidase TldD-related protein [Streptomyces sp. NPDC093801]|uniref:metallopeptidase TldD-related protein n=1 Tax=Streptomyces sp. NPDC093801 TaxID=3155203 RepID=UPI00344D5616
MKASSLSFLRCPASRCGQSPLTADVWARTQLPTGEDDVLEGIVSCADCGVTLLDDPTDPTGFGAARFDAEGLATRRNLLVAAGRFVGRLHDAAGGHRAGAASNGAAVRAGYKSLPRAGARALALVPGDIDPAAVVAGLDHGFLVQGVGGLQAGAGPGGAFSAAVSGRVVRGGELAEYVPHTTLAATLSELLLGVRGVGTDSIPLPGNAKGTTLLVSELTVGGQ